MNSFLGAALRSTVLRRGLAYSLVVGTILVGINQGDGIVSGDTSTRHLLKIGLTYGVPFWVPTLSSVSVIQGRETVRKCSLMRLGSLRPGSGTAGPNQRLLDEAPHAERNITARIACEIHAG